MRQRRAVHRPPLERSNSIAASRPAASEWADAGLAGVYRAGDCLAPRYIADVVFDGHRMGREICSPDPQRPRAVIREQSVWTDRVQTLDD